MNDVAPAAARENLIGEIGRPIVFGEAQRRRQPVARDMDEIVAGRAVDSSHRCALPKPGSGPCFIEAQS